MNRIKELRKLRNMSQEEFAKKIGTSQANLSGWETGKWEPSSEMIFLMSHLFSVSPQFLMGFRTNESLKYPTNVEVNEEEFGLLCYFRLLGRREQLILLQYGDELNELKEKELLKLMHLEDFINEIDRLKIQLEDLKK